MLFFIMHDQLAYGGLVSLLNLQTLQIKEDVKAVACRATWRVDLHDLQIANNLICSKRLHLDDALSQLNGVQFYFSCITAVSSNAKASQPSGPGPNRGLQWLLLPNQHQRFRLPTDTVGSIRTDLA